jgi:hypothetical protein
LLSPEFAHLRTARVNEGHKWGDGKGKKGKRGKGKREKGKGKREKGKGKREKGKGKREKGKGKREKGKDITSFQPHLSALLPMSLVRRVALDPVSQALLGANKWASSFAKALVDVGYPFLLTPGIMEVVDFTLVRHLLAYFSSPHRTIFTLGHAYPLVL